MKAYNLLANEMNVSRPKILVIVVLTVHKAKSGGIVEECVNPNVHDVTRVKVNGNSPGKRGTGNAEVLKTGLYKVVNHFMNP